MIISREEYRYENLTEESALEAMLEAQMQYENHTREQSVMFNNAHLKIVSYLGLLNICHRLGIEIDNPDIIKAEKWMHNENPWYRDYVDENTTNALKYVNRAIATRLEAPVKS